MAEQQKFSADRMPGQNNWNHRRHWSPINQLLSLIPAAH